MAVPVRNFCERCHGTMNETNFYRSNNKEKYPLGHINVCKKCATMHVDNFDPKTYLWILEECDVPYVPDEWNRLLQKFGKDPSRLTSTSIIGRYLAKMALKQWCEYRWEDTKFLQDLAIKAKKEAMEAQGYNDREIKEKLREDPLDTLRAEIMGANESGKNEVPPPAAPVHQPIPKEDLALTDEDQVYLRMKWGNYQPDEWIQLEKMYDDMMQSYDIQSAAHIDNLKLVCKASLKAHQLIDLNDIEGFQKMQKAYDSLMKSGNFTAAQNKSQKGEFVNSIGELVAVCEKEGFIPRYYVEQPNDKVDETIRDIQRYTRTLITEEMNLGSLIEEAVKALQKEDEEKNKPEEELSEIDEIEAIHDQDIIESEDELDEDDINDDTVYNFLHGGRR